MSCSAYTNLALPDLYEAGIVALQAGLEQGLFSSVDLVTAYLARIDEVNLKGPELRAVLETSPVALEVAEELDVERRKTGKRSMLHGIPVLLKDNMATVFSEGMNTTAGSYALLGSVVPDDAGVVKRLRRAGAVILGKTNMSEMAHFRGVMSSGWSARGGQCRSAYHARGSPSGSSSGSGVAASIGLATVTLGTETDGSIVCPSSGNNVVGIKPTVGLTSRAGVLPISRYQDTVGPMTRSVEDAAIVLSIIAGEDPNDDRTKSQPVPVPEYTKALDINALHGKHIGIPRSSIPDTLSPSFINAFDKVIPLLEHLGATIIDPANLPSGEEIRRMFEYLFYPTRPCFAKEIHEKNLDLLYMDFKLEINEYFTSLKHVPTGVRSLADLIKFNIDNAAVELPQYYDDQSVLIESEKSCVGREDEVYKRAVEKSYELGVERGIDAVFKEFELDGLVLPAQSTHTAAALAGYPIVTVPLGFFPDDEPMKDDDGPNVAYPAPGMPFGMSFIGTAYDEFKLIGMAYAFEQATKVRVSRRAREEAVPKTQLKPRVQ